SRLLPYTTLFRSVRDAHGVLELVGEGSETGAEDEHHARPARHPLVQEGERFGHVHISIPATVAVMNAASVPPTMALSPRRERSLRREGAIPPIPPIWIAIELKLAKPHSA